MNCTERKYLLWGSTNTDAKLAEYAHHLTHVGCKGSTLDLHLRIIRAFWHALGLSVPRLPDGITVESDRIALSIDQVHDLIQAVRQHGSPRSQALLALSTINGLGAAELASAPPASSPPATSLRPNRSPADSTHPHGK